MLAKGQVTSKYLTSIYLQVFICKYLYLFINKYIYLLTSIYLQVFICSASEGAGDEQVLQVPDEGGRVGVAPELRDHRPQLQVVSAPLHSFRQLRSQVCVLPAVGISWQREKKL